MKTKAEIEQAETGKPGRNFCFLLFQPATAQRRKTEAPLTALTIIFVCRGASKAGGVV
jgi:hypothetical protein